MIRLSAFADEISQVPVEQLDVLAQLAGVLEARVAWAAEYRVRELVGEFSAGLRDELDFRIEARNATEIAQRLESASRIRIPRVYDELSTAGLVRRFLKGRLNTDRINAIGVADYAESAPEQITAMIRAHAEPHGLTGGFGGRIALTDGMIHQQDIRRSVGIPRTIDQERLRTALDFARFAPTIHGAWRARGLVGRASQELLQATL